MPAYDTGIAEVAVERVPKHATWTKAGPLVSRLPDDQIAVMGARTVGTVGDASTLGLWGFATGTWIVATVMSGQLPASALGFTIPVLLVFAGVVQFIAGLLSFRRANVLAGSAFCCFGAFNTTVAVALLAAAQPIAANSSASILLGFLLVSFGFIAFALSIAALKTNAALVAVLITLCAGYTLSGIPHFTNPTATAPDLVAQIGGYCLMASAFFAYYAGMALVVNSTWGRALLPLGGEP